MLACAQALTATGLTVLVLLGGIVAAVLAPRESLATVPISMAVVAVAFSTAPAALLMRRIGRKAGFILGASIGAGAALFTALAITRGSFVMLCAGAAFFGTSTAFTQQYRFAAAECVPPAEVSRAVSWILIGSLVAALIGPPLALLARRWLAIEYAGSFVAVAGLYVLGIAVLARLRLPAQSIQSTVERARNATQLLSETTFRVAVLAGVVAFAVMSFVMTAAPISMHVHHDHSVEATTWVIQSHVVAMFLPSLFTGRLVGRFGERAMMRLGAVLLAGCAATSLAGEQVVHYWLALVLLGLGWNLLFVSGTTLLARSYGGVDRHRAQAINEFIVFGVQSCVSLLAGVAVSRLGWQMLNLATLPLLVLMLLATWRLRR